MRDKEMSEELTNRLRRVEGQIRGIERMIKEERECHLILGQIMAARAALEKVGLLIISKEFEKCFGQGEDLRKKDTKVLEEAIRAAIKLG